VLVRENLSIASSDDIRRSATPVRGIDRPSVGTIEDAAAAAMGCVGVDEHDAVAIVCNPPQRRIAEALKAAASALSDEVSLAEYPTVTRHGEEPPPDVTRTMHRATVILAPTVYSLSHTQARVAATSRGARFAGMSSLNENAFAQALPVNYRRLARRARLVAAALTAARTCRISSPAGADAIFDLGTRRALADDGDLRTPGAFGNLPAGEAYIAPVETDAHGIVIVDGAIAGYGILRNPLRIQLDGGRVVGAEGEAAEWLLATLNAGGPAGRVIAEIGVGVNPGASISGISILDEKALGTAHIAFGTNTSFGGANTAEVHVDAILRAPMISLDGRVVLDHGQLMCL
jgi:leucyl aminopeptidase (aminopeptidase T)